MREWNGQICVFFSFEPEEEPGGPGAEELSGELTVHNAVVGLRVECEGEGEGNLLGWK